MSTAISLVYVRGAWSVRRETSDEPADEALTRVALARGRERVRELFASLADAPTEWRLELPKSYAGARETALGLAAELADRCESSDEARRVCVLDEHAPPGVLEAELRRRGLRVRGARRRGWLDAARWVAAGCAAAAGVLAHAIRHGAHADVRSSAPFAVAVHDEKSNRTKHVLPFVGASTERRPVLLLGRPRGALSEARERLGLSSDALCVRPLSWSSTTRALPRIACSVRAGHALATRYDVCLTDRDLLAVTYRAALGHAMGQWWRQVGPSVQTVVFGHTGTADTSLLERAMHARGTTTIHVVHGVSAGVNFSGISTLAYFRCEHDAAWHRRLGGYGRCLAPTLARPAWTRGDSGTLLLTNLAHPMNPIYATSGLRDELDVVAATARTADRPIAWKPHPVVAKLGAEVLERLREGADRCGVELLPLDADTAAAAKHARHVIATASTVLIDLLAEGRLGVLLDWQSADPESALGRWPWRATDDAALQRLLESASEDEHRRAFEAAWQTIGPARPLRAEDLRA